MLTEFRGVTPATYDWTGMSASLDKTEKNDLLALRAQIEESVHAQAKQEQAHHFGFPVKLDTVYTKLLAQSDAYWAVMGDLWWLTREPVISQDMQELWLLRKAFLRLTPEAIKEVVNEVLNRGTK